MNVKYKKKSFEDFRKGTFGNGGQNLYVSKKGVLQRIFNFDVTGNGYPDIPLTNSHGMGERPALRIVTETPDGFTERFLPSGGSYDACSYDLTGDGYDDLIVACQHNGVHSDSCGIVYYGSENGLTTDYRIELPAADSLSVAVGRFSGDRPQICFIRSGSLRVYPQDDRGFSQLVFTDIPVTAVSGTAGDFDGDGYDDLYLRCADGSVCVLWGSPEGLSEKNITVFAHTEKEPEAEHSTSATRRPHSSLWRCACVSLNGKQYLFKGGEGAEFYACSKEREISRAFSVTADHSVHAVSGDFTGNGKEDLVILCAQGFDEETESLFFPDGEINEAPVTFGTRAALSGSFAMLKSGPVLCVAQNRTSWVHTCPSQLISFNGNKPLKVREFDTFEPQRIVPGKFNGKDTELCAVDHESGRVKGDEPVYLYLGGPWEYGEEHRIELMGSAAVDLHPADLNDDGITDILMTNCSENDPAEDPGSFIYYQDKDGFSEKNRVILPTIRSHGAAVGDFRHSGYLDIVTGGLTNREIRIFRGGPSGYSTDNMDRLILGPETPDYTPQTGPIFEESFEWPEGEKELAWSYGELRWMFAADLTGNGYLDLFVSTIMLPYVMVFLGGPDGFSNDRCIKLNAPGAINCTVADLNKNGYPDLILSHHFIRSKEFYYESYITIYWGGPDGYKENRKTMLPTHCANSVTVGDFNGNGWLDIYATCYNNGRERDLLSYVYRNNNGHFDPADRYALFNHSGSGCLAGDFNGDGYCDLVVAHHKEYGSHQTKSALYFGGPDGLSEKRCVLLPSIGPHGLTTVQPGNIMDRGPEEYYESEPIPVPEGTKTAALTWKGELLGKGYVKLRWKTAETEEELVNAPWCKQVENGEAAAAGSAKFTGGRLAVYQIALGAPCSAGNVRINEVEASFEI